LLGSPGKAPTEAAQKDKGPYRAGPRIRDNHRERTGQTVVAVCGNAMTATPVQWSMNQTTSAPGMNINRKPMIMCFTGHTSRRPRGFKE
jgi:hypothetical protein